jgi:hypothetical protein
MAGVGNPYGSYVNQSPAAYEPPAVPTSDASYPGGLPGSSQPLSAPVPADRPGRHSADRSATMPPAPAPATMPPAPATMPPAPATMPAAPAGNGHGYPAASGYPTTNGYPAANGYPTTNGYPAASGYPAANGYPATNGYPPAAAGQFAGTSYPDPAGYQQQQQPYRPEQHDQRGYAAPDMPQGVDAYQGYPGYGSPTR